MAQNTNDINILVNNGVAINQDYISTAFGQYSTYFTSNSDTISQVIQSINQNLVTLNYIQNQMNTHNNLNQEALIKEDQLLRMQNDDLMKQLKELEVIQSTIANKERLTEQTNESIKNEESNIKILIISIVLAFLLLIGIYAYGNNRITPSMLGLIFIIILSCYLILFMYSYNIFYFKDAVNSLFDRAPQRLGNELKNWSETVKAEVSAELQGLKSEWIQNNCACPAQQETEEEDGPIYAEDANVYQNETPGYFYNDGSAPPQLLVPTPIPVVTQLTQSIDWVDYSQNGQNFYNSLSNDPRKIQQELLNRSGNLVGDNTNTENL